MYVITQVTSRLKNNGLKLENVKCVTPSQNYFAIVIQQVGNMHFWFNNKRKGKDLPQNILMLHEQKFLIVQIIKRCTINKGFAQSSGQGQGRKWQLKQSRQF